MFDRFQLGEGWISKGELLYDDLAAIEGFSVTAGRDALHTPQPHQPQKGFLGEPRLRSLRFKSFHQTADFFVADFCIQRHEKVRLSHVAVILWNFVFENQMIPERIPSKLSH